MNKEDKKHILSELDDEYKELIKRGEDLLVDIDEKKKEIEENEDFEMEDYDVMYYLNETYDDVEILGDKYDVGEILKKINPDKFYDIKNEESETRRDEQEGELNDELNDLEDELEDLKVEIEEYEK